MATLTSIRNALVTRLEDNWSHAGVPRYYENAQAVDLAVVTGDFVRCTVEFLASKQANIANAPTTRYYGLLTFDIFAREGEGVVTTLGYMDDLVTIFAYKNISGVQVQTPDIGKVTPLTGWVAQQLRFQFHADANT